MRFEDLLLLTPRLTPTEAQFFVMATWSDEEQPAVRPTLAGRVVGPMCEYAKTLTDRIPLIAMEDSTGSSFAHLRACARILEPCFWDPEHPFCYELTIDLLQGDRTRDARRVVFGLRHLEVDGVELLLNGQPFVAQGVRHIGDSSIAELELWHDTGCNVFLTDVSKGLCDRTDRWGPIVFHILIPTQQGDALAQVKKLRNHPSLLMWVLPPGVSNQPLEMLAEAIRKLDPSRPIGRLVDMRESTESLHPVDVLFLPIGHPEITEPRLEKPWIAVASASVATAASSPDRFKMNLAELRSLTGSRTGLAGVIL